jgi:TonB family protein
MNTTYKYLILTLIASTALVGCRDIQDASDRWGAEQDSIQEVDLVPPPPLPSENGADAFDDLDGIEVIEEDGGEDGGEQIPGPKEFVLLEKEPVPLNLDEIKQQIGYPREAKEAEIDGKVVLRILIDEQGKYVKHIVLKDPHPLLTRAVEKEIPALRFSPGEGGGKLVKTWVTIPFQFALMR